ncbi:unnamed protein product [Urochloa humidicola]
MTRRASVRHRSGAAATVARFRRGRAGGIPSSSSQPSRSPLHPPQRRLHSLSFLLRPDALLLSDDTREMEATAQAAEDGDHRCAGELRGRAPRGGHCVLQLAAPTAAPAAHELAAARAGRQAGSNNSSKFFYIFFQLEYWSCRMSI